jgi:hypothetical protein
MKADLNEILRHFDVEVCTAPYGNGHINDTYLVESEYGVDIRKKLFHLLAERDWPIIGLESLGMSLEDIFITVVDRSEESKTASRDRVTRRNKNRAEKNQLEREVGASLFEDAQKQRAEKAQDEIYDEDEA